MVYNISNDLHCRAYWELAHKRVPNGGQIAGDEALVDIDKHLNPIYARHAEAGLLQLANPAKYRQELIDQITNGDLVSKSLAGEIANEMMQKQAA